MDENKLTLQEHFEKCKADLEPDKEILRYSDSLKFYRLSYSGKQFMLYVKPKGSERQFNWNVNMVHYKSFTTVDEFWSFFSKENNWLHIYKPEKFGFGTEKLIAAKIILFYNKFMQSDFDTHDYWLLHKWVNSVYSELIDGSEYKQYCPNCKSSIFRNSRYPKYLCGDCSELIVDKEGRQIEFINSKTSYKCIGFYVGTNQTEQHISNSCYLNGLEYYAEDAHFGGIVIQLME